MFEKWVLWVSVVFWWYLVVFSVLKWVKKRGKKEETVGAILGVKRRGYVKKLFFNDLDLDINILMFANVSSFCSFLLWFCMIRSFG